MRGCVTQVRLNPWNFDYVVNGMDNVVVFFHAPWCDMCSDLLKEMVRVGERDDG